MRKLEEQIIRTIEAAAGRHAEEHYYAGEAADPGLVGGLGSISWELHADLASLVIGGSAALVMEVLHPSVMHGVYTYSSYRTEPTRRARNTLGYVLRTTFGNTQAATTLIETVRRAHARVSGVRADGVRYRALDPELITWVHSSIPWGVMAAFEATRRPLSRDEKNRYLREQAVIGRLGGAEWVPETVEELEACIERTRPQLAVNDQTLEFLGFLEGRVDCPALGRAELFDRWLHVRSAMALMPEWARRMTGTYQPEWSTRQTLLPALQLKARIIRWAYPELPCVAMAHARVAPVPSDGVGPARRRAPAAA